MAGYKGKQGRKRKPDALKLVQGTFRKDRANPNQLNPDRGIPKPMNGILSKEERKHYYRIAKILDKMGIMTEADVIILEILAQALQQYYVACEEVKSQPLVIEYKGKNGNRIKTKNPWINIMNEERKTVISLLSKFGLDPSARASLNILQEDNITEEDNPYARLSSRK